MHKKRDCYTYETASSAAQIVRHYQSAMGDVGFEMCDVRLCDMRCTSLRARRSNSEKLSEL